ncbi:PP2C family protein-serine/threonine phosphatase [Arabiibacter massiliensis]|uniref:PP2C family protein-serine/threonine phosphatase n=1 Tax=Arabiibacter massiliensis TaxID=1870985 RepID=UPI0009BAAB96|nr:PP2C family serine/threonine-protein phosphatase [Arabiibacter massiliensis]
MFRVVGVTDRGAVKLVNEDRVAIDSLVLSAGLYASSWDAPFGVAVFDGVSAGGRGCEAAGIASAVFADLCEESLAQGCRPDGEIEGLLRSGLDDAHKTICAYRASLGLQPPPASTVAGIYFTCEGSAVVFNAGDSRVYRYRNGLLVQLSHDHTIIQRLVDAGASDELVAQSAPDAHVITRALGMDEESGIVEVSGTPSVCLEGDLFLICSDGLTEGADSGRIEFVLAQNAPLPATARTLVNLAKHNGSTDNISVVLVQVCDGDAGGE